MKVLVCGGRYFKNWGQLEEALNVLRTARGITHIIHGGATGADELAGEYARSYGIQEVVCPANWGLHGRKAGPMRNKAMLDLKPDLMVAFPGGAGTANSVGQAQKAGVEVIRADSASESTK